MPVAGGREPSAIGLVFVADLLGSSLPCKTFVAEAQVRRLRSFDPGRRWTRRRPGRRREGTAARKSSRTTELSRLARGARPRRTIRTTIFLQLKFECTKNSAKLAAKLPPDRVCVLFRKL